LISGSALAADYVFEWDANTEQDLEGYRFYQSDTSGVYTFGDGHQEATIPSGTETTTLLDVPTGDWFWVVTAYDSDGNESEPSNEVSNLAPNAPLNLKKN
jgi:hypothetical protein